MEMKKLAVTRNQEQVASKNLSGWSNIGRCHQVSVIKKIWQESQAGDWQFGER